MNGFSFVSFEEILSETKEDAYLVDVIGLLTGIGSLKKVNVNGKPTDMIEMELDNLSGSKLKCTLWQGFAIEMAMFKDKNVVGPKVVIVHFAKMKMFKGVMGISNTKYCSRLFINSDLPEIVAFKSRIPYGESSSIHSVSQLQSESSNSMFDEFMRQNMRKTIIEIKD